MEVTIYQGTCPIWQFLVGMASLKRQKLGTAQKLLAFDLNRSRVDLVQMQSILPLAFNLYNRYRN
jgi:hypothetical protein